jgi:hypothetical protein
LRKALFLLAICAAAGRAVSDVCAQEAQRPVVVAFSLPAQFLPEIPSGLIVELLADGNKAIRGRDPVIDHEVNPDPGTIRVKATFDGMDEMRPGQSVTIHAFAGMRILGVRTIGEVVP